MNYSVTMATEYGKRLRQAMAHAKINQKELVKRTGLAQSTVSSALNRSSGSSDTALYARACGVDAHWLATGDGEMDLPSNQPLAPVEYAQAAIKGVATLEQSLEGLATYLAALDDSDRREAMKMIASLSDSPERHAKTAAGIRGMVGAPFAQSNQKAA